LACSSGTVRPLTARPTDSRRSGRASVRITPPVSIWRTVPAPHDGRQPAFRTSRHR
jgi:hypothetical protein